MNNANLENEEDNSINLERIESEEKSVYDKIKYQTVLNSKIVVKSINSIIEIDNYSDKNSVFTSDNKSLISNQIYSANNLFNRTSPTKKFRSIPSNQDLISNSSYFLSSTSHNSNNNLQDYNNKNSLPTSNKFFSPQKNREIPTPLMSQTQASKFYKYSNTPPFYDSNVNENIMQQELKKISLLVKLKEKEMKEMLKNYDLLKTKVSENKKSLNANKDHFKQLRQSNICLKKLICGIIKNKNDIKEF